MTNFPQAEFQRLWLTLERLLGPGGCPWDRKQSAADVARFMVEEGQEWRDAVDEGDPEHQAEELGDLAFLLMFGLQRLAADEGIEPSEAPRLADEKLRRRHPDIFGEAQRAGSVEAQTRRWEDIKREERGVEEQGLLKPLPRSMGALAKAHRYQDKAASVGFDWPRLSGVLDKMQEELGELREELAPLADLPTPQGEGSPSTRFRRELDKKSLARVRDEIGDLFFVLANLCRWLNMDAEDVAEDANAKFLRRFAGMESRLKDRGAALEESSLEEMEAQWQGFKADSD
jgi:MazG family protein